MQKTARVSKQVQIGKQALPVTTIKKDICRHYNVSDARKKMKKIIAEVANNGQCITIGQSNVPSVIMMPVAMPISPIGNYEYKLACVITEELLGHAPIHIKRPQIEELSKLNKKQLFALMDIEEFPLSKAIREKILAKLSDSVTLERLEKRRMMADSILAAKKEGLYEASEHATGLLTFED